MCGIVGYIGNKQATPVILDGLKRLEYRGYDSAGIAVAGNGDGLQVRRAEGKLRNLEEIIRLKPLDGTYGIGHTRWATHGRPNEANAHPHTDCRGSVVAGVARRHLVAAPHAKSDANPETTAAGHATGNSIKLRSDGKPMQLHWDGNNDMVEERNLNASLATGALPPAIDHESIECIEQWLEKFEPPIPVFQPGSSSSVPSLNGH